MEFEFVTSGVIKVYSERTQHLTPPIYGILLHFEKLVSR